jgi:hypothetical protein
MNELKLIGWLILWMLIGIGIWLFTIVFFIE